LRQDGNRFFVCGIPLVAFLDYESVFRMEVSTPEDMIADSLEK
jgi:hypothetical protein